QGPAPQSLLSIVRYSFASISLSCVPFPPAAFIGGLGCRGRGSRCAGGSAARGLGGFFGLAELRGPRLDVVEDCKRLFGLVRVRIFAGDVVAIVSRAHG